MVPKLSMVHLKAFDWWNHFTKVSHWLNLNPLIVHYYYYNAPPPPVKSRAFTSPLRLPYPLSLFIMCYIPSLSSKAALYLYNSPIGRGEGGRDVNQIKK